LEAKNLISLKKAAFRKAEINNLPIIAKLFSLLKNL
jgi:hypothetical protein